MARGSVCGSGSQIHHGYLFYLAAFFFFFFFLPPSPPGEASASPDAPTASFPSFLSFLSSSFFSSIPPATNKSTYRTHQHEKTNIQGQDFSFPVSFICLITTLLVRMKPSSSKSNSPKMSSISSAVILLPNVMSACLNSSGSIKCLTMVLFFLSVSMTTGRAKDC
jgi:hypothetical protein